MSREHLRFVLAATYCRAAELVDLARHAEACGFDDVAVSDHLVVPERIASDYPYRGDGTPPFDQHAEWSDPWVAIATMAAVTERLHFVTNVYILPLRDPFSVAKAVGTAAVLSGNRVSLGVGVGWMREEYTLVGRSFGDRGRRADEMIELVRRLWSGEVVEFDGRYHNVDRVRMSPAPTRRPPILVGGESIAARRRASKLGDGYISIAHRSGTLAELRADLDRRLTSAGRDRDCFEFLGVVTDVSSVDEHLRIASDGITGRIVVPWDYSSGGSVSLGGKLDAMSRFAELVIHPVRDRLPADGTG